MLGANRARSAPNFRFVLVDPFIFMFHFLHFRVASIRKICLRLLLHNKQVSPMEEVRRALTVRPAHLMEVLPPP